MEALTWSEQYYQSVAGSFLSELTAVMEYLGRPLTLSKISRILSFKEEQAELLNALKDKIGVSLLQLYYKHGLTLLKILITTEIFLAIILSRL